MPDIKLPDGNILNFDSPVSVREVAEKIGKKLAKAALAGVVDGEKRDMSFVIENDCELSILTSDSPEGLELMRHSAAHVMAEAISQVFPGTKFAYGPAVDDGFYYDVDSPETITAEDLPKIERAMLKLVKANRPFERNELTREEAVAKYKDDEYKLDNIERAQGDVISFYKQGEFEDLCRGPHVPSAGKIGHAKIMSMSGAYWHGDESRQQLTRIYGTCWPSREELEAYLKRIEEAKARDHRKLGRELGLFEFHPESPGQAFWRPNGTILFNQMIAYCRELCEKHDYEEIRTPTILDKQMWVKSGHWENYQDKMYITEKDDREFGVKPMNCPGGVILYKNGLHSHNDLPLRWAEFGYVHRHEGGGEIHGLVRVRGFTQDDAHIFCTPEQLQEEIRGCIAMVFEMYGTFGLEFDHIELSTRPEKSIGTEEMWKVAEDALRGALEDMEIEYKLNPGDGAFYGPKIDFHVSDAIGRTWQMGTIQVDFAMPENFDMTYVAADSSRARPVMVHRAILGSIERFMGILTEHYAGDFPLWLAPQQVRVLTITDKHVDYAREVVQKLKAAGLRVKLDDRSDKIGSKIREGELQKVQVLAVVGDKEMDAGEVAVRRRKVGDLGSMKVEELVEKLVNEIKEKAPPPGAGDK